VLARFSLRHSPRAARWSVERLRLLGCVPTTRKRDCSSSSTTGSSASNRVALARVSLPAHDGFLWFKPCAGLFEFSHLRET
jgi:hypothetical protein